MKLATPKKTNRAPSLDYARLKEAPIAELVESDVCAATGDTPSYEMFAVAAKTACETHLPIKPQFVCSKPWLDTDIITARRRIIEECTVRQECQCAVTFIDVSKAFDSISRTRMEKVLYKYGLSTKIVTAVMSMYSGTAARVVTADGCSADFDVEAGVLQGDTLAPYLFVIVVDYVLRAAIPDDSVGFLIQKRLLSRRHPAKYADDIALLSGTMANAQTLLTAVEENAAAVGLHINMKKTEYIRIGNFSSDNHPTLRVIGGEIAEVADFRYLGSWIMSSNKDFVVRRACTHEAANKLWRVWKSGCSCHTKIRVFKATIESVLLYGRTYDCYRSFKMCCQQR